MHIYGEEAGEKIPIKSLSQEFQKSGLKPSSFLFIYFLCNVTNEKKTWIFLKYINIQLSRQFPLNSYNKLLQTKSYSNYRLTHCSSKKGQW